MLSYNIQTLDKYIVLLIVKQNSGPLAYLFENVSVLLYIYY